MISTTVQAATTARFPAKTNTATWIGCVDSCATDGILFGEESELDLAGAEQLPGMEGLGAHVWYKGLPRRFVAGCVYDPVKNDVVIGAQVTLLDAGGTPVATCETDWAGDWIFEQVEPAAYTARIEAAGYETAHVPADATEADLNTGDLPLQAAR
ncbi:MAG: carboxypeptidase regulatory-like domain-containing protein [Coriobacteriia bacterium]|nr:carboxypeptidase regulatory-like domain-containing protein [Coriobacteriia bacterium]